ncbi:MAG: hypothetical protein LBL90_04310 [Prevotellaceae bacterium]|jgi:hypothetical protein|nr:hypothetical protein [Prevotellaceae bacterium]
MKLDEQGYTPINLLPYTNMLITVGGDSLFYITGLSSQTKMYEIFQLDMSGNIIKLYLTPDNIKAIAGDNDIIIMASDHNLILFSPNMKPTIFYKTDENIQSMAVTSFGGIYIATDKGIIYLNDLKSAYKFCNLGTKNIWYIDNKLYILFNTDSLSVLYPVSNFNKFGSD